MPEEIIEITLQEAAQRLETSIGQVHAWCTAGRLPSRREGRKRLIRADNLVRFLQARIAEKSAHYDAHVAQIKAHADRIELTVQQLKSGLVPHAYVVDAVTGVVGEFEQLADVMEQSISAAYPALASRLHDELELIRRAVRARVRRVTGET